MKHENPCYFCIDMKCFYASVECAARGLDPFNTCLVVADPARGRGALCLAVSPKMKTLGVRNRCRLFEIPNSISYQIATPRMKRYIEVAADVFALYLKYFDERDIYVYSIDEAFIDVTGYLSYYRKSARELAAFLLERIEKEIGIPATAGIGSNLYLAKVALDITAKHAPDHMGVLTEETFCETLWDYMPLTDFWQISTGTVRRLNRYGVKTMRGIANLPEETLYRAFGKDAELLIDHAHGRESCTIADIRAYRSKSHSVSQSQILPRDYTFEEGQLVLAEMILNGCQEMMRRKVTTNRLAVFVGYSKEALPPVGDTVRMTETTNVFSILNGYAQKIYDMSVDRKTPIRRIGICFEDILDDQCEGYDLFTDLSAVEREKKLEHAVLAIKDRFGKNALFRGMDLQEAATAIERNRMIGGHKA